MIAGVLDLAALRGYPHERDCRKGFSFVIVKCSLGKIMT
jgi:hypothetical protein